MGKKILCLCMALALCLGLLPVTALAAALENQVIYVGGVEISSTDYWTTDGEGNVTAYTGEGTPTDNYIHYDAENNVLTLHNATIKNGLDYSGGIQGDTYIPGSAIGVLNLNGDAELTITLAGTNTIEDVSTGIFVLAHSSYTGDASLTITGSGSLTASGNINGINVQSNSGDATLTIQSADVTLTSNSGNGVTVQAGSTNSSGNHTITLSVEGGSLTASGSTGISFDSASSYTVSATNLTVSNNAIVRANDVGSNISNVDLQIGKGNNSSGGIVFDGNQGTVYGKVTLDESLTIGEGESLTIPEGASLTVPDGKTLTNNGTVTTTGSGSLTNNGTINNSGTLPGTISGNQPPKITTTSLPDGKEYTAYNETLQADNDPTQWSVTSGSLPAGLTLNSGTGVISGTPTVDGTFNFTVKATNDGGSDGEQLSIKIDPATLSITTQPSSQSVIEGKTATFSVVATGNGTLTYQWQQSTDGGNSWTDISSATNTTYTIPAATLDMNGYQYHCVVKDGNNNSVTSNAATLTVTALPEPEPEPEPTPPPYIPPSKPNWTSVARKLANAQPGDTVTVKMNGETEVPGDVWETIAGRDVTVILDMGGNVSWTVDGNDVPTATHFADMDFGVDRNTTGIDVDVINAITGELGSVQITLAHDGEFGFTLTLTAPLGKENAGYWANLYHYDENAKTLNYETSAQVASDGTASLRMTHASQYAIVIDDKSHDLPFTDLGEGQWYESAVRYAYTHDIMEGMSATKFSPNISLTRAQAVQVLYNLEGQPTVSGNAAFPDQVEEWYKPAIAWAEQTGVVDGYEDGTFRPGQPVNRMEFAQMLYNYAKYKGYDLTAEGDLSQFPDGDSVQPWAETAMSWANGNELINGHDNGTIDAGGNGTRAQAASILMRFDENVTE